MSDRNGTPTEGPRLIRGVISETVRRIAERQANDPEFQAQIDAKLAALESEQAAERQRQQGARAAKALEASGIPRRLLPMLAALDETEAVRAARAWLDAGQTFLLLGGGVGTGKTVAAAHAVASRAGLFRKARDIATLSQFDAESWAALYAAPVLAIDDLGTEALDAKGWALSAILALLDRRYDDAAKTVITTNLGVEAIRARYGQDGGRLFDRLREAAEWVELGGGSLRKGGQP